MEPFRHSSFVPFPADVDDGPLIFPKPSPPNRPPIMSLRSSLAPPLFISAGKTEAAAAAAIADMALLVTSSSESSRREESGR